MFGNQIINLPVNTQYTYYFYLGNGVLNIATSNLSVNDANDLQTNNPNTGATFQTGNSVISKNGASFVNTTNLPTELGNGWYSLVLTSSEMNFQDILLTIQTHNTDTNTHPWYTSVWLCTTSVGSGGGGGSLTAAEVWDYLLTSGFTTGSIGAYIQNELATIISNQTGGSSPTLEQIQQVVQTAIITFSKE